jgi:alpha-1,3/alpha-1,6-mannosyltransferase
VFLDFFEEFCLLFSQKILVNSEFTKSIYEQNYKILKKCGLSAETFYPFLNLDNYQQNKADLILKEPFFLSLNRYERKKNINLAIEAFAEFKKENSTSKAKLVIAGGYDLNNKENLDHFIELSTLAKDLGSEGNVIFMKNVTNKERSQLIS